MPLRGVCGRGAWAHRYRVCMTDDPRFLERRDDLRVPTREIDVTIYLIDGSQLTGVVFADPNESDPSTAVLALLAGNEPLLRFRSSFDEFLLVGKGSIESVLIEGVEPTTSAKCFVATLSGHRFVGGVPGELAEERLSDAVQMPWIRVYTERGTIHVRSERVLWIKT